MVMEVGSMYFMFLVPSGFLTSVCVWTMGFSLTKILVYGVKQNHDLNIEQRHDKGPPSGFFFFFILIKFGGKLVKPLGSLPQLLPPASLLWEILAPLLQ